MNTQQSNSMAMSLDQKETHVQSPGCQLPIINCQLRAESDSKVVEMYVGEQLSIGN